MCSQGEVFTWGLDGMGAASIKGEEARLLNLLSSQHFQVRKAFHTQI